MLTLNSVPPPPVAGISSNGTTSDMLAHFSVNIVIEFLTHYLHCGLGPHFDKAYRLLVYILAYT